MKVEVCVPEKKTKKMRMASKVPQHLKKQSPLGLIWDEKDYSCAYDSLFAVLFHLWSGGQLKHRAYFEHGAQLIQILHVKFSSLLNGDCTFESIRDHLRERLNLEKPLQYQYGPNYTDIDELVRL